MHFPANLLPSDLLFTAHFAWFMVLVQVLRRICWRQLYAKRLFNVFSGALVALLLLWSFDVSVTPGLGFHFLGVTVFTLMFGWPLSMIGVNLATAAMALSGAGSGEALSLNALLFGVLPVSVSFAIYRWAHRYLPHHVFIYIFVCAFGAAILAAGAVVFAAVSLLVITSAYTWGRISAEYLPFLPLYLFPEGVLNGMLATILIGLRPQWLTTFDDESYLKR